MVELSGDTWSGSVKLEVVNDDEGSEPPPSTSTSTTEAKVNPFPPQPGVDHKLVQDFLNGDYCLHGGSGWWKYEFCYGRKVEQYHEDRKAGIRNTILLGQFSLSHHKAWLEQNPEKAYKLGRRYISHFYSGGTNCDLTGRPRQVEVKLKCRESSSSPSAVTLYLLEPQTCQYVLGVETPIVCWLLPHVDSLGLYTLEHSALIPQTPSGSTEGGQDQASSEAPTQPGKGEASVADEEEEEENENN